jgi:hypothetical protein
MNKSKYYLALDSIRMKRANIISKDLDSNLKELEKEYSKEYKAALRKIERGDLWEYYKDK